MSFFLSKIADETLRKSFPRKNTQLSLFESYPSRPQFNSLYIAENNKLAMNTVEHVLKRAVQSAEKITIRASPSSIGHKK